MVIAVQFKIRFTLECSLIRWVFALVIQTSSEHGHRRSSEQQVLKSTSVKHNHRWTPSGDCQTPCWIGMQSLVARTTYLKLNHQIELLDLHQSIPSRVNHDHWWTPSGAWLNPCWIVMQSIEAWRTYHLHFIHQMESYTVCGGWLDHPTLWTVTNQPHWHCSWRNFN